MLCSTFQALFSYDRKFQEMYVQTTKGERMAAAIHWITCDSCKVFMENRPKTEFTPQAAMESLAGAIEDMNDPEARKMLMEAVKDLSPEQQQWMQEKMDKNQWMLDALAKPCMLLRACYNQMSKKLVDALNIRQIDYLLCHLNECKYCKQWLFKRGLTDEEREACELMLSRFKEGK